VAKGLALIEVHCCNREGKCCEEKGEREVRGAGESWLKSQSQCLRLRPNPLQRPLFVGKRKYLGSEKRGKGPIKLGETWGKKEKEKRKGS